MRAPARGPRAARGSACRAAAAAAAARSIVTLRPPSTIAVSQRPPSSEMGTAGGFQFSASAKAPERPPTQVKASPSHSDVALRVKEIWASLVTTLAEAAIGVKALHATFSR